MLHLHVLPRVLSCSDQSVKCIYQPDLHVLQQPVLAFVQTWMIIGL